MSTKLEDYLPADLLSQVPPGLSESRDIAAWLGSDEAWNTPAAKRWHGFLTTQFALYTEIKTLFPVRNSSRIGSKDEMTVATSPHEMLFIANRLYIAKSYGLSGGLLECGCFKGFSSCCLSLACRHLGIPFYLADSFQGLPPHSPEVGEDELYQAGDFAGSRREVEENLAAFGALNHTTIIEGWYDNSLKDFSYPLLALWLDVDLASSVRDVFTNCRQQISKQTVVFSHEFVREFIEESTICTAVGLPGELHRQVVQTDEHYQATYLIHNLAEIVLSDAPAKRSSEIVALLIGVFESKRRPTEFRSLGLVQSLLARLRVS